MTNRALPALFLALAVPLSLAACDNRGGTAGGSPSSTSGSTPSPTATGATTSTTTTTTTTSISTSTSGAPASTPPRPTRPTGPQTPPPGPQRPVLGPQRLYAYEPHGASRNAWMSNGAKAGIITSAEQIPGVVASLPASERATAGAALAAARAQAAPSRQRPWYVFAADGCQVTLKLVLEGGNPKPIVQDPPGGPVQCFAPEWRAAVFRYDASHQTVVPPTFTPPKG